MMEKDSNWYLCQIRESTTREMGYQPIDNSHIILDILQLLRPAKSPHTDGEADHTDADQYRTGHEHF